MLLLLPVYLIHTVDCCSSNNDTFTCRHANAMRMVVRRVPKHRQIWRFLKCISVDCIGSTSSLMLRIERNIFPVQCTMYTYIYDVCVQVFSEVERIKCRRIFRVFADTNGAFCRNYWLIIATIYICLQHFYVVWELNIIKWVRVRSKG